MIYMDLSHLDAKWQMIPSMVVDRPPRGLSSQEITHREITHHVLLGSSSMVFPDEPTGCWKANQASNGGSQDQKYLTLVWP